MARFRIRRKLIKCRIKLAVMKRKMDSTSFIPSLFNIVFWLPTKTLAIPLKLDDLGEGYFQLSILSGWRRWATLAFHADLALHAIYVTFAFFRDGLKLTICGMLTMDALIYMLSLCSVWMILGCCIGFDLGCRSITALYNTWSLVLHQFSGMNSD